MWRHKDAARFYESNGGPGPRGTPTLSNGRVYTHGATGIVNALDANTGAVVWSRNSADTGAALPGWGFHELAPGDRGPGDRRRFGPARRLRRSHRHAAVVAQNGRRRLQLAALDDDRRRRSIVLQHGAGAMSVAPADGAVLWQHTRDTGVAIVQPVLAGENAVLIVGGDAMGGKGLRRLAIAHGDGG